MKNIVIASWAERESDITFHDTQGRMRRRRFPRNWLDEVNGAENVIVAPPRTLALPARGTPAACLCVTRYEWMLKVLIAYSSTWWIRLDVMVKLGSLHVLNECNSNMNRIRRCYLEHLLPTSWCSKFRHSCRIIAYRLVHVRQVDFVSEFIAYHLTHYLLIELRLSFDVKVYITSLICSSICTVSMLI